MIMNNLTHKHYTITGGLLFYLEPLMDKAFEHTDELIVRYP